MWFTNGSKTQYKARCDSGVLSVITKASVAYFDWHRGHVRVTLFVAAGHPVRIFQQCETMVNLGRPIYRYFVDEFDVIIDVDDWWLAFAKENNAAELSKEAVAHKSLWEFIADAPTRSLYKEIHAHVRAAGVSVTVPFRCDSPTLQRHMELTISRHTGNQLRYESTVMRVVPEPYVPMLDSEKKRSREFLTMCSFCKRSLIEPSGWLDLANISVTLRLFERETVPQLRYTVCPECTIQTRHILQQTSA